MSQYAPPPAKIGGQKRPKIWHKIPQKIWGKKTVVNIYLSQNLSFFRRLNLAKSAEISAHDEMK